MQKKWRHYISTWRRKIEISLSPLGLLTRDLQLPMAAGFFYVIADRTNSNIGGLAAVAFLVKRPNQYFFNFHLFIPKTSLVNSKRGFVKRKGQKYHLHPTFSTVNGKQKAHH